VIREDVLDIDRDELIDRFVASETRREELEQQLQWFKKQLFGQKSERRTDLQPDPSQLHLGEHLVADPVPTVKDTPVQGHTRRVRKQPEETGESGLRFDESVPIERIEIPNPELEDLDEHQIEEIGERITHQLAQQPASYKIIETVRKVVKRKGTGELT